MKLKYFTYEFPHTAALATEAMLSYIYENNKKTPILKKFLKDLRNFQLLGTGDKTFKIPENIMQEISKTSLELKTEKLLNMHDRFYELEHLRCLELLRILNFLFEKGIAVSRRKQELAKNYATRMEKFS